MSEEQNREIHSTCVWSLLSFSRVDRVLDVNNRGRTTRG